MIYLFPSFVKGKEKIVPRAGRFFRYFFAPFASPPCVRLPARCDAA